MKNLHRTIILLVLTCIYACSAEKFVPEGSYILRSSRVENMERDANEHHLPDLTQYIQQQPNTKWLSMFKVPLGIYALSGRDTTKWINRTLQRIGEKPVTIDTTLTIGSLQNMTQSMQNHGYLDARVVAELNGKNKSKAHGGSANIIYKVYPGTPYIIDHVKYDIKDTAISRILTSKELTLHRGQIFSVENLTRERQLIVQKLQNNGYYLFNKEHISYDVDSSTVSKTVNVTMHLGLFKRDNNSGYTQHPAYRIRNVRFDTNADSPLRLRQNVVKNNTMIMPGDLYSYANLQQTYNNFSRFQAVKYTGITFSEVPDSNLLDCRINLQRQKTQSIQFQPEGTNTAGDFGAAVSLTYMNRNVFHGSEVFNLTARVAYEAISGLEGYQNHDYMEYGVESSLKFPRLLVPFYKGARKYTSNTTSELNVSYNMQNRPEFHRRLFNAGWRYRWNNSNNRHQYKLDFLEVNYLWMPWISSTFKSDYIESASNRNVILRYNYEDILITKFGFGYTYAQGGSTLRLNAESSGNLLHLGAHALKLKKNDEGAYTVLGIAFAQYAKGDIDYTHAIQLDEKNSLVLHGRVGVAFPYSNSSVLPFEKRYFSGGANSLRGWTVRSLGPGRFVGNDGKIDFINQTGDIRLDLNAEIRTQLVWKLQGALFIDAGNIWTIRDYENQPGGQFHFKTFWQEIAANYGIGFRLNFDYFILRFDMGMKAVNPAYDTPKEHFPIIYPKLSRDFAFHFAVGMPF